MIKKNLILEHLYYRYDKIQLICAIMRKKVNNVKFSTNSTAGRYLMAAMKSSEEKRSPTTLTISKRNGILSECPKQDINLLVERIKKDKKEIMGKRVNPSIFEAIRPEIIDSWIRSYYYGLDHLNFKDGPVMAKPKFEELLSKEDYLIKAAHPYITKQKDMLSDTDFLILLTNAYGVLLSVDISNKKVIKKC
jgi:hypothetical protein